MNGLKRVVTLIGLLCLMMSFSACLAEKEKTESDSKDTTKLTSNTSATVPAPTTNTTNSTIPTTPQAPTTPPPTTAPSTVPTTSITTAKPTTVKPTAGTSTAPSVKPGQSPITDKKAEQIAKELIAAYDRYAFFGVCCDVEYYDEWMEQYLTPSQKQRYLGYQMRITCCSSVQEVRAHTAEVLHESQLKEKTEDALFTDNKGHVYVMYEPFGFEGVTKFTLLENTANRIVAQIEEFEYDPEFEAPMATTYYTIVNTGGSYKILNVACDGWLDPSLTQSEAQKIAEDLIFRYGWYTAVQSCCDDEYVWGDMSELLTKEQKKHYYGLQYRITCCKTVEEVRAHIDSVVAPSLLNKLPYDYPDDMLFTDDNGNLYLIVIPTESAGYGEVTVEYYSDIWIEAKVELTDYDGVYGYDHFVIVKRYGDYMITSVTYTSA